MTIPPPLEVGSFHVDRLPTGQDLTAAVRTLNGSGERTIPWCWTVDSGPLDPLSEEGRTLTFGVNGTMGGLSFATSEHVYVPVEGTNGDWAEYFTAGSHSTFLPPRAEVRVELVYAALEEFLDSAAMPTCVTWQEVPVDVLLGGP